MKIFNKISSYFVNILLISNIITIYNINGDLTPSSSQLYTACNNLDDGVQWIRPIGGNKENGEEYPNIQVQCVDGWTILNYNLDSYISQYFSSFTSWTEFVASSELDDRVGWTDWFIPTTETTKFRVSADCQTCASNENLEDYSTYFMTGNYIGCLWVTKGMCDMETSTLECFECSTGGTTYSGLCSHMELSADTAVYVDHDLCTTNNYNVVPALGTNGQYCVCYQPEEAAIVDAGQSFERAISVGESEAAFEGTVEVYSYDFSQGTYRITRSGYYKLMEDVEFNMNAPDNYDEPNVEGAWYPTIDQSDKYEGCDDSFVGAYSMGFFCRICNRS